MDYNAFPGNEFEALALLYIQNQDLKNITPEKLLAMYDETVAAMQAAREKGSAAANYF